MDWKSLCFRTINKKYLSKNGDMLYYSESGGSTYSLSVGVAYGIGSVSLGIPLGKLQREHSELLLRLQERLL